MADSILVAEDERASAEYLKLLLEQKGFEVRLAGSELANARASRHQARE